MHQKISIEMKYYHSEWELKKIKCPFEWKIKEILTFSLTNDSLKGLAFLLRHFKCSVLKTLSSKTKHLRSLVVRFNWIERSGFSALKNRNIWPKNSMGCFESHSVLQFQVYTNANKPHIFNRIRQWNINIFLKEHMTLIISWQVSGLWIWATTI